MNPTTDILESDLPPWKEPLLRLLCRPERRPSFTPSSILTPMVRAALEQVVSLDPHAIQILLKNRMQPFLDYIESSNAFDLATTASTTTTPLYHIIGIRPRNLSYSEMMDICKRLQDEENIYIAVRAGLFRISPYIDNTVNDVQTLIQAFKDMDDGKLAAEMNR